MFCCGWPGWKWIATWKNWPIVKFFLCIVQKMLKPDYSLFFLREIPQYFLPDALMACWKIVKNLSSFDQTTTKLMWQCLFKRGCLQSAGPDLEQTSCPNALSFICLLYVTLDRLILNSSTDLKRIGGLQVDYCVGALMIHVTFQC